MALPDLRPLSVSAQSAESVIQTIMMSTLIHSSDLGYLG